VRQGQVRLDGQLDLDPVKWSSSMRPAYRRRWLSCGPRPLPIEQIIPERRPQCVEHC
jgi:hypothetical protein